MLTLNPPPWHSAKIYFLSDCLFILFTVTLSKFSFSIILLILKINVAVFRIPTDDDIRRRMRLPLTYVSTRFLRDAASRILSKSRSTLAVEEDAIFIPRTEINMWGKNGPYSKSNLMNKFCGYPLEINRGKNEQCMLDYLTMTEHGGMQNP